MTIDLNAVLEQLEPDVEPVKRCFLSVYSEERCYGGPEEGGWWYDWYTHEGSKEFPSREAAERAKTQLLAWIEARNKEGESARWERTANLPDDDGPYLDTEGYIPTGWSDGGEYVLMIEDEPGENQTTERPYYC